MYILIFVSLLSLFLTYLESAGQVKKGMAYGFGLLTLLATIHYDFGNDYMPYYNTYNQITAFSFNWDAILNQEVWKEPGWALLCYLFLPLGGFFTMVAFLSVLQNIIYYRFIKRYVAPKWWTFSVFIYLFSTSYYVLNMSMFRQGLAIALFVWAFTFFKDRKLLPATLIVICAASVHNSAKILLPFLLWGFVPFISKKITKSVAIMFGILFLLLSFNGESVNAIFMSFADFEDFQIYTNTYEGGNSNSYGLGFVFNTVPFFMFLYYLLRNSKAEVWQIQLVALACIGTFIIPFGNILPMVTRIGMYFGVFTIAAIPIVYKWIYDKNLGRVVLMIYIMMTLYDYYLFFTDSAFVKYYTNFHTIFSVL